MNAHECRVHLDGYNQLPYLLRQTDHGNRDEFPYFNDDGKMVAFRYKNWKGVFCEMTYPGGFDVWRQQFNCLRVPKLFNLRMDPMERADIVSDQYDDWMNKNGYLLGQMIFQASAFLETFIEYPPSQIPDSFTIDGIGEKVNRAIAENAGWQATVAGDQI